MTSEAEAIDARHYRSRRYAKSLLKRSWRLLREFELVGLAYLVATVVWFGAGSLFQRPLLVEVVPIVASGFAVAVSTLAVARVSGRSTASRSALLRGAVVGTVLVVLLVPLLVLLSVLPFALPALALEFGVSGLVVAVLALCAAVAFLYLSISLALVVPATIVDRVGPITGFRRGWTVAKTVRLPIILVYAVGLGLDFVSRVVAWFVVSVLGPATLGAMGVQAIRMLAVQVSSLFLTVSFAFLYVDRVADLEAIE